MVTEININGAFHNVWVFFLIYNIDRFDYCNALLYCVTESNISRLQRVQNSLARAACAALYRASSAGLRRSLHWFPVKERLTHKVAAMAFTARFHHKPIYLAELLVDYVSSRALISADKLLLVEPRTKTLTTSRAFRVAGSHISNSLPLSIRSAPFTRNFRDQLKTFLFDKAYNS